MSQIWLRYRGHRGWTFRFVRVRLHVSVDSAPPVAFQGGQTLLPVAPGRRHIRVWRQRDYLLGPTGWFDTLDREKCVGDTWIDVPAGGTVEVEYRPGFFQGMAATLLVVQVHVHDGSTWTAWPAGPVGPR